MVSQLRAPARVFAELSREKKVTEKRQLQPLLPRARTPAMRLSCTMERDPSSSVMSQRLLFNRDIPRVKAGSKQQLSQEVLNATKSVPNSAFPPPAAEGMTELQLAQVTGKQPVEIPLSISTSSHSSPRKGGEEKAIHPLMECLLANAKREVGSTSRPESL